jgi:hypothetical protein
MFGDIKKGKHLFPEWNVLNRKIKFYGSSSFVIDSSVSAFPKLLTKILRPV